MQIRFALLAVCITPGALAAQTLKKCDPPKTAIGQLRRGMARAWYKASKDGKPDTSSVAVLSADSISVSGARSIITRTLSACRFDMPSKTEAAVVSGFRFDSTGVNVLSTSLASEPPNALPLETFDLPKDSLPLGATDKRIEELPRLMSGCHGPPPPSFSARGGGSTPAEAQAEARRQIGPQIDEWNHRNSGQMSADILVTANGKVSVNVRVLSSSNPSANSTLIGYITSCTWAPGRYHGVPIDVHLVAVFRVPALVSQP